MKKLMLWIIALSFAASAQAVESASQMLLDEVKPALSTISVESATNYESEDNDDYKGRSLNRAKTTLGVVTKSSNTLSRTVVLDRVSKSNAQLENLESTAGELVQKVEDDRLKVAKKHQNQFIKNKSILEEAYTITEKVKVENLGSEQDPKIQNAFKCGNLEDCNKDPKLANNGTNAHDIKDICQPEQRLHWNGSKWSCISLFQAPAVSTCKSGTQYSKLVNGGTACIDYIFKWKKEGTFPACTSSEQTVQETVSCNAYETATSTNSFKTADKYCLGSKPIRPTYKCEQDIGLACDSDATELANGKCSAVRDYCIKMTISKRWVKQQCGMYKTSYEGAGRYNYEKRCTGGYYSNILNYKGSPITFKSATLPSGQRYSLSTRSNNIYQKLPTNKDRNGRQIYGYFGTYSACEGQTMEIEKQGNCPSLYTKVDGKCKFKG